MSKDSLEEILNLYLSGILDSDRKKVKAGIEKFPKKCSKSAELLVSEIEAMKKRNR